MRGPADGVRSAIEGRERPRARRPLPRKLRIGLALACAAGSLGSVGASSAGPAESKTGAPLPRVLATAPVSSAGPQSRLVAEGRELFRAGCASCHGVDAGGIRGVAPSLHGVGAASADFYLSTGRMPLSAPTQAPTRTKPAYNPAQRKALVAYVGSLGGPPIPEVRPESGSLEEGRAEFTTNCAGCHQVIGEGGIVTGAVAPPLHQATPTQIAEAVRVGPYLMPHFSKGQIDDQTLNSIVRYILYTRHPVDEGGWGIGHIGPIPEGMIAWLLAGAALILLIRLIGERTT